MGRGKKRHQGEGYEDQYGSQRFTRYGAAMRTQDSRDFAPPAGKTLRGGGDAGGSRPGREVHVVRSVPKFLQSHAHLLGRKQAEEEGEDLHAQQRLSLDDEDDRKLEEVEAQEAFEKAVVDDPSLVEQFPQLQAAADRAGAAQAKERGNQAFAAQQYDTAARHFTDAIALSEDPTFYSNRAAAYQALGEHRKAVKDAKRVVLMDKSWVKGWFRLATAHSSLKEWSEAKEACETGLRLEPDHPKLEAMRIVAEANEASEVTARVVRFKQSRHTARPEQVGRPAHTSKAVGNTRLLSFGEAEAL